MGDMVTLSVPPPKIGHWSYKLLRGADHLLLRVEVYDFSTESSETTRYLVSPAGLTPVTLAHTGGYGGCGHLHKEAGLSVECRKRYDPTERTKHLNHTQVLVRRNGAEQVLQLPPSPKKYHLTQVAVSPDRLTVAVLAAPVFGTYETDPLEPHLVVLFDLD